MINDNQLKVHFNQVYPLIGTGHNIKMIGTFVFVLMFAVVIVCSDRNQGILLQLSSGENICNNVEHSNILLRNFSFSDILQFEAMCNIPVPNKNQVNFLLENNVMPILCMGVYDVMVRLCKIAIVTEKNTSNLSEIFPPTTDKFNEIFKTLSQSQEYSNISNFCVEMFTKQIGLVESSNNYSRFWWDVLNKTLQNQASCHFICRTTENGVNPLCSFILWSVRMAPAHKQSESHLNTIHPEFSQDVQEPTSQVSQNGSALHNEVNNRVQSVHINSEQVSAQSTVYSSQKGPARMGSNLITKLPELDSNDNIPDSINQVEKTKSLESTSNDKQLEEKHTQKVASNQIESDGSPVGINEYGGSRNKDLQIVETERNEEYNQIIDQDSSDLLPPVSEREHPKHGEYQEKHQPTLLIQDPFIGVEDSHFFTYFLFMSALTVFACLALHNKKKLLALAVEGRRTRRRPNTSNYSKLDCSLEEALGSNTTASVTQVLY